MISSTTNCSTCNTKLPPDRMKCPNCGQWQGKQNQSAEDDTIVLSQVKRKTGGLKRIPSSLFGGVAGAGGFAIGCTYLFAGEPGAGKSTSCLQLLAECSNERECLYLCAEEIEEQVQAVAERLDLKNQDRIRLIPMGSRYPLQSAIEKYRPLIVILDSLPKIVPQLDQQPKAAAQLKTWARQHAFVGIVINHVTKESDQAGLQDLEHEVDATMTLYTKTDEPTDPRRILRSHKNRTGPTELRNLLMTEQGLIYVPPPPLDNDDEDEVD